ncbi:12106_t:CDS:2, partial [Gigaspora margarita]
MIEQAANIESSTSYMFYAETSTSSTVNTEFSTSYMVNVQPNSLYTIGTKTNALSKNVIYNKAPIEEINNKMQYDFSLLKLSYMFLSWDDVETFFKAYSQYYG